MPSKALASGMSPVFIHSVLTLETFFLCEGSGSLLSVASQVTESSELDCCSSCLEQELGDASSVKKSPEPQ